MNEDSKRSDRSNISRRLFLASTAGATASTSLLSRAMAQETSASPRILKFSDHQPLGIMRTQFLKDVLFPAIEKESNGRLKVEDHWNGEIAAAYDALSAVSEGRVDMATTVPEYTAEELPLQQIFKSFPTGPSGDQQIDFFRHVYAEVPAFTAELEKNNILPLFYGTGYPVAFYSTVPLASLDDLKGGKWRSASFWHQDFLRNAGAVPVSMPWGPEIYDALKDGTLDGLMVNVDSGYTLDVHDVAPNVLVSKDLWLGHVYPLTMNKDVWGGLSQEDKDAIQRAAEASYQSLGSVMDNSFDAQLDELKNAGASVRILTSDEITRWQNMTKYQEVQSVWVKEQESKDVKDAGAALTKTASIIENIMK